MKSAACLQGMVLDHLQAQWWQSVPYNDDLVHHCTNSSALPNGVTAVLHLAIKNAKLILEVQAYWVSDNMDKF